MLTNMKEIAFQGPDIAFLHGKAKEIGLEIKIPKDIKEAQDLKDNGIEVPGSLDPEEAFLLSEICRKVESGGVYVGADFVVYLNDRGNTNIPEDDFQVALARQTRVTFNNLVQGVNLINSSLKDKQK